MIGNIHIMGIVNLNGDSFYAGSRTSGADAVARARQMWADGADVVDLGACSTRPGSAQPSLEEEWSRLEPVLRALSAASSASAGLSSTRKASSVLEPLPATLSSTGKADSVLEPLPETLSSTRKAPSVLEPLPTPLSSTREAPSVLEPLPETLSSTRKASSVLDPLPETLPSTRKAPSVLEPRVSIDTYRAEIVRRAYEVIGPFLVNDISAGEMDREMLPAVGRLGLPYVAMHMRGTPETMQSLTDYDDVVAEVIRYFRVFSAKAADAGIRQWFLDPGFGFAKTVEQNYELLRRLGEVKAAFPQEILVGLSRKSMIYRLLGITPDEAMPATQVLDFAALERGATWLRVHDVLPAVHTARLFSALQPH